MSSPSSPELGAGGGSGGGVGGLGLGLSSPRLLRAVEPKLALHLDSEDEDDDQPAVGSSSRSRQHMHAAASSPLDEEEILLPPAAAEAATTSTPVMMNGSSSEAARATTIGTPVAVDEPPSSDDEATASPRSSRASATPSSAASTRNNGSGGPISSTSASASSSSSASLPPTAAPSQQAHYATHLWFGVDAVLEQSENARVSNKALGSFLRDKAALDRSYAADLRRLTARWVEQIDLPARASPAQSGTVTAGLVALRTLALQTASAVDLQAERLDEEATDPFLDEVSEAMVAARLAEQKARAQCKALEAAMDNLASHKGALQRACTELAQMTSSSPSRSKGGPAAPSRGDSSWMADLVGLTPFKSNANDLAKKIPALDAKYTAAIRRAREARGEFDASIGASLAELEHAELRRLKATRDVSLRFAHTMQSGAAGSLKRTAAAVAVLGAARPQRDLGLFIHATVKRTGGRKDPPPLPVYRQFKGHPNYAPPSRVATPSAAGTSAASSRRGSGVLTQMQAQMQAQAQRGGGSSSSTHRRGASGTLASEEPATDSDADAADSLGEEEEVEMSDATDSAADDDDAAATAAGGAEDGHGSDSGSDSDSLVADHTHAGSLSPTSASQLNSAEQASCELSFAQLIESLRTGGDNVDADEALNVQVQLDAAGALLDRPAGRAALAAALKRAVAQAPRPTDSGANGGDGSGNGTSHNAKSDGGLSHVDALLAVEPIMPVSPSKALGSSALEQEDALNATGGSIFSVMDADADADSGAAASSAAASAPRQLVLPPRSFDQLASLLLRLLDACQLSMHAQPAMSVLRTSRRIVCAPDGDGDAGAGSSFFALSSSASSVPSSSPSASSAAGGPVVMLSRLQSHDACSSVRLWELAFFESLSRAHARRPTHRWHTDAEQRAHAAEQVDVSHRLLRRFAREMLSMHPALSDAQLMAFVDKFAHMQQMSQEHMDDLLTLPCFVRQGITIMPSDAAAGKQRPIVASSSPLALAGAAASEQAKTAAASSNAKNTPGKANKAKPGKVPVAMPVAAATVTAPVLAAPSSRAAPVASPASALSSASTPSSTRSSSSSSSRSSRAGRSILQAARPPFDTALEVEVLGDVADDMDDVGL